MFGGVDPASGTERVVVVAETRETDQGTLNRLRQTGMEVATGLIGMPPDEIILAPPQTVLKTSSGKIRRSAVRELYERGGIGRGPRSVWWQVTRMALASAPHRWRRARRRFGELAYATWVHGLFWLLVPPVFLAVVLLPGAGLRWSVMRGGARLLLWLAAIPTETRGFDRLPADEAAVLVANHSSYLDSLVLVAILPEPVTFIAKGELREQFLARLFLQRIGARMVERFDWRRGARDAHAVAADLRDGRSLLFFPEGTLTRAPGLLPFHMGAFIAAADTGAPVNTLVIRGTRSILRDGSWFPHRGPITVTVGEALRPAGADWEAAVALRNAAREDMLARLGEPDLAAETPGPVKPPAGNPQIPKGDER
jgi:1-acyl-sn-glycerol-3-phosphate acyltransferase